VVLVMAFCPGDLGRVCRFDDVLLVGRRFRRCFELAKSIFDAQRHGEGERGVATTDVEVKWEV
jgi:hypothetical protein